MPARTIPTAVSTATTGNNPSWVWPDASAAVCDDGRRLASSRHAAPATNCSAVSYSTVRLEGPGGNATAWRAGRSISVVNRSE